MACREACSVACVDWLRAELTLAGQKDHQEFAALMTSPLEKGRK
jgi:hypothetical protein